MVTYKIGPWNFFFSITTPGNGSVVHLFFSEYALQVCLFIKSVSSTILLCWDSKMCIFFSCVAVPNSFCKDLYLSELGS